MKDTIIQNIAASINVLNNIPVSGKQNLANMSGCISILEETMTMLLKAEIHEPAAPEKKDNEKK